MNQEAGPGLPRAEPFLFGAPIPFKDVALGGGPPGRGQDVLSRVDTVMLGAWYKDFNLNLLPKQSSQTMALTKGPP